MCATCFRHACAMRNEDMRNSLSTNMYIVTDPSKTVISIKTPNNAYESDSYDTVSMLQSCRGGAIYHFDSTVDFKIMRLYQSI